ncbi:MAG: GNAT family N-acetyltransferase [Lactobacillales bacterium]|jgi:RimJ/RimL family protein N-acetyltransferase|nr:GNAT family N-acetyltransferase [Lactobacillales bacterium]
MEYNEIILKLAENIVMETPRLRLRPVTLADAEDMFDYATDLEMTKFVFPPHDSIESTREAIANFFMKKPLGAWGIELKDENKFIGTLDLRPHEGKRLGSSEFGWSISHKYQNQGYASEALSRVLELAFNELGQEVIFAIHDVENPASGRAMARAGMTKRGTVVKWQSSANLEGLRDFDAWQITRDEFCEYKLAKKD